MSEALEDLIVTLVDLIHLLKKDNYRHFIYSMKRYSHIKLRTAKDYPCVV